MFLHKRLGFMPIYYRSGDGPAGGGEPAASQPGAQEEPPGGQQLPGQDPRQQGGLRGRFANIPDDQWAMLEPHLQDVDRHVGQLEQQFAPFKAFVEAGYTPEAAQGLLTFAQSFDKNPLGSWLAMAEQLQRRGVIDEDLDLEELVAVASGAAGTQQPEEPQVPQIDTSRLPPWAKALYEQNQMLSQKLTEIQESTENDRRTQQQQAEDRLLRSQVNRMKGELKEAGVPEDQITDQRMIGLIMAYGGDVNKAIESEVGLMTSLKQGQLSSRRQKQPQELPDDQRVPTTPSRSSRPPRDAFEAARGGAQQMLEQAAKEQ